MSKIKLAVTGGIGSGKSVVCHRLQVLGVPVYDCDARAKELMLSDEYLHRGLERMFGAECFTDEGTLNRKWLAERIFVDKDALKRMNELVHPCVKRDFKEWAERQDCDIVAVESAILYESGLFEAVDKVMLVWADTETCISRICNRSGMTRTQILNRMANQMSVDELLVLADYSVFNDGETPVIPELMDILNDIERSRLK